MFTFQYLKNQPVLDVNRYPILDGNINGPCLMHAPGWIEQPKAKYYLYFAHHEGDSIRLAFADSLIGPWRLNERPALHLSDSLFSQTPPKRSNLHPEARQYIESGADGNYPHIASPDILIDKKNKQIRLYYHGRLENGLQRTRVAISNDGLNFKAQDEILGLPYFRVFKHHDYYYALAMPGVLYRSENGLNHFSAGPQITDQPIRHFSFLKYNDSWLIFWTRVGDQPERIYVSEFLTLGDWCNWKIGSPTEIHRPTKTWEGSQCPLVASQYGSSNEPVNQLRDPYICQEKDKIYLLYAIAGEQGIAIGELVAC